MTRDTKIDSNDGWHMKRLPSVSIVRPSGPAIPNEVTMWFRLDLLSQNSSRTEFARLVVVPSLLRGRRQTLFSRVIATKSTCRQQSENKKAHLLVWRKN